MHEKIEEVDELPGMETLKATAGVCISECVYLVVQNEKMSMRMEMINLIFAAVFFMGSAVNVTVVMKAMLIPKDVLWFC